MPDLNCPRCGLTVAVTRHEDALEHCPRCLARTGGALSIALAPPSSAAASRSPGVIPRLTRRGRSLEAKS
jgi:hypothetical protein